VAQPDRAQFTALRYLTLDGTDHESHREQANMIRRCIAVRNRHVTDAVLRKVIKRGLNHQAGEGCLTRLTRTVEVVSGTASGE
jgi:hypothetical protein